MGIFDRFKTEKKSIDLSDSETLIEILGGGTGLGAFNANYTTVVNQGYKKNPTLRRGVDLIANAIGSLEWKLLDENGVPVEDHEILDLVNNPNRIDSCAAFFTEHQLHKLLNGQSFILGINPNGNVPTELKVLRPDRVSITEGRFTKIGNYSYSDNSGTLIIEVDPTTGESDIFRNRYIDPLSDTEGCSPVVAAMRDVMLLNNGLDHNLSILKNKGVPSAIISYIKEVGEETRLNIEKRFDEGFTGRNRGKTLVTAGSDIRYQSLAMSNVELDYIESANVSSKAIGMALGIPLPLLGATGAGVTDLEASHLQLWIDTIIPEADKLSDGLSTWLLSFYPELNGYKLVYDKDAIDALEPLRRSKYKKVAVAMWTTINEQREATGFQPLDGEEHNKVILTGISQDEEISPPAGTTLEETDGADQVADNPMADDNQGN